MEDLTRQMEEVALSWSDPDQYSEGVLENPQNSMETEFVEPKRDIQDVSSRSISSQKIDRNPFDTPDSVRRDIQARSERNTPSQEIDRDPFHTPDWVRRDFRATYERILV